MPTNFLYRKKVKGEDEKIYILGIPVYAKSKKDNYTKYSYLFSIFQKKDYFYSTSYYVCRIKVGQYIKEHYLLKNDQILRAINRLKLQIEDAKMCSITPHLHKEVFGPYKNAFRGKTVVLVASGPTAKYHIKNEDAIYVGVNNSCLLDNIKLDYLFCQDFYMDEEKREAIVNYRKGECKKFFGKISEIRIGECRKRKVSQHVRRIPKDYIYRADAKEYFINEIGSGHIFAQDIELSPLMGDGSVVFPAMQFILHTHPAKIYLVGCDCSSGFFYKSDVKFDNNYMIDTWKEMADFINELYPDIKVTSLNPIGLKGIFNDEYTEEYLKSLKEEKEEEKEKARV